jgi:steroid 5-alpha reductase family enzyme
MKEWTSVFVAVLVGVGVAFVGSDHSLLLWGWPLFALSSAMAFLIQFIVFIPSYFAQTEHYYDLTGSMTYVSVVVFGFALGPRDPIHILMGIMVCIWAIRLGSFLFLRIRKAGEDTRFAQKNNFAWFLMAWTIQGLWVVLTSAPVIASMTSPSLSTFHPLITVGGVFWVIGMSVEVVADRQKTRFRSDPNNKDKFISSGLWGIVQHPNYAGEILLWSGLAVMAIPQLSGLQYGTLISPIFVFVLLRFISGVPLLAEKSQKRWGELPEFQEYVRKTPLLLPRFW